MNSKMDGLVLPLAMVSLGMTLAGCESEQIGRLAEDVAVVSGKSPEEAARIGRIAQKTAAAGEAAFVPVPEPVEIAIGQSVAMQAFERFGPYLDDPKAQKYVNLVGNALANTSDRPTLEYRFAMVESAQANAFAAPGGYIFISTGLLKLISDEAELAGILGHQIAHVSQKHALRVLRWNKVLTNAADAAATAMKKDARIFAAVADAVHAVVFDEGLNRTLESEADRLAAHYAQRVGYQARAVTGSCLTLRSAATGSAPALFRSDTGPADRLLGVDARTAAGDVLPQQVVYVKSRTARIRAHMSASAEGKEVPAGTPLKVLAKNEKYYHVQLPDGNTGWVFHVCVTDQRPDSGTGSTGGVTLAEALLGDRTCGLEPMAEDYAKKKGISQRSLDDARKMQELLVSSKEVDAFLREGKLGEYAEVKK